MTPHNNSRDLKSSSDVYASEANSAQPNFDELFHLYGNDILRVCNFYLGKRALAEDAFQDVFVKAMTRISSYRGDTAAIKFWLLSIARNVCKDYLKSTWLSRVGSYEDWHNDAHDVMVQKPGVKPTVRHDDEEFAIIDQIDSESDLMQAVKALPAKYKDVILLRFYYDLSTKEIATYLEMTENTVRSRLFRARKMLSPFMKGEKEDD